MRRWFLLALPVAPLVLAACGSCRREHWGGPEQKAAEATGLKNQPPIELGPPKQLGAHPRILLDAQRLAGVQRAAKANHPAYAHLTRTCEEAAAKPIPSGYEAWDWGSATLACALLWRASPGGDGEARARTALKYFQALLDDRTQLGDGKGGAEVVRHDSGYPIRTYGFLGAVAYDWLHDAPGMTPELRKKASDRFSAWTGWFGEKGYMRDKPIANYYAGYFGAVAMAGIATEGDDPRGAELRNKARLMFQRDVAPTFRALEGGQWPEGWQYGGAPTAILAIYADTEKLEAQLPFLTQMVDYRTHALWPDGEHIYDNGDWSKKPAVANGHELWAAAVALEGSPAARARSLSRGIKPLRDDPWTWLEVLAWDPAAPVEEARQGALSYLARGTGNVFARTAWSAEAVWASFQSGPHIADHQHLDQGHFEVVRGADALLVDGGGYGAGSSTSHNTLLIDDGGASLHYAPNQTAERSVATVSRFEERGPFVYALGDITSAYGPREDGGRKSVRRAEREWVFSRTPLPGAGGAPGGPSARLVLYDRVTLDKGEHAVTWAAHTFGDAQLRGTSAVLGAGGSSAIVSTVLPEGATFTSFDEPTPVKKDSFWYNNKPPEGLRSTRLEVASPRGKPERRFLHVIAVTARGQEPPAAAAVRGERVDGAAVGEEAYLFAQDKLEPKHTITYSLPSGVRRQLVTGLPPGARYATAGSRSGGSCAMTLRPSDEPSAVVASGAGILVLEQACGPGE